MDKRIAVVTGANRGLGLGTARKLAEKGMHVVLASRSDKAAVETDKLKSAGLSVESHELDVSDAQSIMQLTTYLEQSHGRVNALVNNAGVLRDSDEPSTSAQKVRPEVLIETLKVNTIGPYMLIQSIIPLMKKAGGGCIVNVSSGMGGITEMNGGYPGYRLSKAALNALTRIFHDELHGEGFRINSVCPGWVRTEMGGAGATRSIDEGISGIVWAATLEKGGPSGGFFRDSKAIAW